MHETTRIPHHNFSLEDNLRFADDIELMRSSETELQVVTARLENASDAYGMNVS